MPQEIIKEYEVAPKRIRKVRIKPETATLPAELSSDRLIQASQLLGHFCKEHLGLVPLDTDKEVYAMSIQTPGGKFELVEVLAAILNCLED